MRSSSVYGQRRRSFPDLFAGTQYDAMNGGYTANDRTQVIFQFLLTLLLGGLMTMAMASCTVGPNFLKPTPQYA